MSAGQGVRGTLTADGSTAEVRIVGPAVINITGEHGTVTPGFTVVQMRDPDNNLVDIPSTILVADTPGTHFLNFPVESRNSLSVKVAGTSGTVALVIVTQGKIVGD